MQVLVTERLGVPSRGPLPPAVRWLVPGAHPSAAGDERRPELRAGEPARQLGPIIWDWLLVGFLPGSSSSGTPVMPIRAPAAGCLCLALGSMWLPKWKESIEVGCPAPSKVGDRIQNSCTQNKKKLLTFPLAVSQFPSYLRRRRAPVASVRIGAAHRS